MLFNLQADWNTHKAYAYKVTVAASTTPISVTDLKVQLRLDTSDTSEDTYLTNIINAAVEMCEKYTRRDLINKTYVTYRDSFSDIIEIRRSKLQSITSIQYYDTNNTLQTLDTSVYSITDEADYSAVYLNPGKSWPSTYRKPQAVKITFVAGYGSLATNVPAVIKQGLLMHAAMMYENRGDCGDGASSGCSCESSVPSAVQAMYAQFKIIDLSSQSLNTRIY